MGSPALGADPARLLSWLRWPNFASKTLIKSLPPPPLKKKSVIKYIQRMNASFTVLCMTKMRCPKNVVGSPSLGVFFVRSSPSLHLKVKVSPPPAPLLIFYRTFCKHLFSICTVKTAFSGPSDEGMSAILRHFAWHGLVFNCQCPLIWGHQPNVDRGQANYKIFHPLPGVRGQFQAMNTHSILICTHIVQILLT